MSYVTEHIIMFVIYSLGVTLAGNSQAMRRETSLPQNARAGCPRHSGSIRTQLGPTWRDRAAMCRGLLFAQETDNILHRCHSMPARQALVWVPCAGAGAGCL